MPENQENGSIISRTKNNRCRSFHFRYVDLCRSKNTAPLPDIRKNNKDQATLDFFGDKLSVSDWLLITEAISYDITLQVVSIRLRRCQGPVLDHMDTERKAKLFKQKPVIHTKFVFAGIIDALSNCIEANKNLRVLNLEGLPLSDNYVESIAKSLSSNTNLKEISFARSNIFDKGCETVCNTLKYLENVEKLNLSDTGLTTKGAEHIADMIKIQKINRYTEGWQQSLRYRAIDPDNIPGLRSILLARNPQIGDEGLTAIVEVLKEDVWVKVVDMENCGLTDRAANILLDCLSVNNYLQEFNVRGNPGISKYLLRNISDHLKKDVNTDKRTQEEFLSDLSKGNVNGADLMKNSKVSLQQLLDQLKATNEQLELERRLRKKAEELNEKLTSQIRAYQGQLESMNKENGAQRIGSGMKVEMNIKERHGLLQSYNEVEETMYDNVNIERDPHGMAHSERNRKISFIQEREKDVQFSGPLPEPTISPSESARSGHSDLMSARQTGKVRKVKSEMKYVEPTPRDHVSKRKETKSDYDYTTESDVPHFETNIGDTMANLNSQQQQQHNQHSVTRRTVRYSSNVNVIKKYELDEISLATSRSQASDAPSAESETLRCNEDPQFQQMKAAFSKHAKPNATKEYGQGEGGPANRSPRTLFLGLCED